MNLFFTSNFSTRIHFPILIINIVCSFPTYLLGNKGWNGPTPSELAPGSRPLGSMKKKFFNIDNSKLKEVVVSDEASTR